MARLTTFSRLLITLLIVAALFFVARKFIPGLGGSKDTTPTTEQPTSGTSTESSSSATAPSNSSTWGKTGASFTPTAFTYSAPMPNGGKLKGVVELGATGFNSFIIRLDAQKNWKLEKAEFGVSLVKEGLATDDDVKNGLKRYIADMLSFGVGPKDIHFVVSSGAQKEPIMPKINGILG